MSKAKKSVKKFFCSDCGFEYPKSEMVIQAKVESGKAIDDIVCERCSSVRDRHSGLI